MKKATLSIIFRRLITKMFGVRGWRSGLLHFLLGMTIFARSAGTQPGLTLMGRVLPGPIRNRVRYGFF